MTYPNPCTQCGFCCVSDTCPVGQDFYRVGKYDPCHGLTFDGPVAFCRLSLIIPPQIRGIGLGCCILARVIKNGVTYDFASLPPAFKQIAVAQVRRQKLREYNEAQDAKREAQK